MTSVDYELSTSPMLANRETIAVHFMIGIAIHHGWRSPNYDRVRAEVMALSDSAVNRWALGLHSAGDCLKPDAYASLQTVLEEIYSDQFTVRQAVVAELYPISPPPEPEPSSPLPPGSPLEGIVRELNETVKTTAGLIAWVRSSQSERPDLWTDKEFGHILTNAVEGIRMKLAGRRAGWQHL